MNTRCALALASLLALSATAEARDPSAGTGWTEYRNDRFGFSLRYPSHIFSVERTAEAGDGQVFVAQESDARLLVGALANDSGYTPAAYQEFVARRSYGSFEIGYRRLGGTWFVLSGEGNGKTFYEKVMFSCGGRTINSFAMIYPTEQRHVFDPIVEGIEDTFRPGRECGQHSASPPAPATKQGTLHRRPPRNRHHAGPRSELADSIARRRGHDVIVVLRRTGPPYDYRVLRGYASRP